MPATQIIRGSNDACQPTVNNIAEALAQLTSRGCNLETGKCWLEVPAPAVGSPSLVARLYFAADDGAQTRIDLPTMYGCRAKNTLSTPIDLPLADFNEAEIDPEGNVRLANGSWLHAVTFKTVRFPGPWTELDEAIVWLTIRVFKAEHVFLRRHLHVVGIDYGILHNRRCRRRI